MGPETDLLHLLVADLDASLVVSRVPLGLNSKTSRGAGRSNEIKDCFVADQRLALPVHTASPAVTQSSNLFRNCSLPINRSSALSNPGPDSSSRFRPSRLPHTLAT
jgi:hypothetical protein